MKYGMRKKNELWILRGGWAEKKNEEIMAEIFPNLMQDINLQTQDAQKTPNSIS